jgi:hypothetical protein
MDWNGIQRKLEEDERQREEDQRRARQQVHLQRIQEMVAVQQRLTELHQAERAEQHWIAGGRNTASKNFNASRSFNDSNSFSVNSVNRSSSKRNVLRSKTWLGVSKKQWSVRECWSVS